MATERVKYLGKRELTIKEFEALDTLNPNIDYNLTDFPQFYITNEQMAYALTCKRLFNIGSTFICSDEGNYSKGHIYQIIGNPKEWKDITATVNVDNITINKNVNNDIQTIGVMDETNNVNKVHSALTKEQFDALTEYDENTFYPVIDETGVDSIGGATGDILLGTNLSMTGNTLNASSSTEYMHHIFLRVNEAQSQAIMTFELRNKNSTVLSTLPLLANALAEQGFRQGNYFRYHTIAGIDTDNNIIINGIGSAIDLGTSFENYVKIKGVKINFTGANISDFETTVKSAFVLEDVVTEL